MLRKWMDEWGYYVLTLLCVGVIVVSALWTRSWKSVPGEEAPALSDESQRLRDAATPLPATVYCRPCSGEVLQSFSDMPVFFPHTGLWQVHQAVDYAAEAGDVIVALMDGEAAVEEAGLILRSGDGGLAVYRGLEIVTVRPGQQVRAGEPVGLAGALVPWEGTGRVCVSFQEAGVFSSPEERIDNGGE